MELPMHHTSDAVGASARAPDLKQEAAAWFRLCWQTEVVSGHVNLWRLEGCTSFWFPANQIEKAVAKAEQLAGTANVYCGTALIDLEARKTAEKIANEGQCELKAIRGTAATACAIPGLWLDLDVGGPIHGPAHKSTKLPPTYEDALALIAETLPLEPTVIIDSGHGLYAWWLFEEPWYFENDQDREEAAGLVYRLQRTFQEKATTHGWDVDGTADLARVLRIPGTFNRKLAPVPVRFHTINEHRRYQPSDFDQYLIDEEWNRVVARAVELPDDLEPTDLDSLPLAPWIKKVIATGNEWDEEKQANRYGSRSQAVWRVINEGIEGGLADETIASILLDPRYKISENPLEKGKRARSFVASQIGKARKHQENKPKSPSITSEAPSGGQKLVKRPLTETGNAERFRDRYGAQARFCHVWGSWLPYDGRHWKRDDTGAVRSWAKETVRSILAEAAGIEDDEERKKTAKWARDSEKASTRAALLINAQVEPGIPILPEQMDADPLLFNIQNGTVDLRTGQLRLHDPLNYITKLAPVYFDPEATCPTFLAFLERVLPDPDVRAFVRRAIGYSLTGEMCEQCLFFLYGGGANGKSTLLGVLQALMGDYARQAAPELLVSRGGDRHPTELADLFGARMVASIEVDEGKRLAETLVKQMTGGDKMKARFMRADFFEWTPTHKLFLAANHRPEIRGTDYAIWRRIHMVPFTVTIPKAERDGRLPAKLLAELPGILNWAIAGCLDWQRNGLGVPQAVRDATEEYRAEQDILADFLAERCVIDPQTWAAASDLYRAYSEWCDAGGTKPLSGTAFGTRLAERGHTTDRRQVGNKRVRVRLGLRLLGPDESPDPDRLDGPDRSGHGNVEPGSNPPHEGDTPENPSNLSGDDNLSGADVAVCASDGCLNESAGPGLHCEACLYADVEDEVPFA
jgi:P4 family phage/plasmid primase-like protien